MILAIGNSGCIETESYLDVAKALGDRGEKMLLFKQDKCLDNEYLVYRTTKNTASYTLIIDGVEYDANLFSGIWYMHPNLPRDLLDCRQVEFRPFIQSQFLEMRKALWSLFRHKRWLNDPWKAAQAESKIFQLSKACEAGFDVPDTIITSDPDRVRNFYHQHGGNIIVKTLSISPILDRVLYTNKVSSEQLKSIGRLRTAPAIFQENVGKSYELRITVVGERFFPVKIHSQADEQTAIDWRSKPKLNDFEVRMEQCNLPDHIEHKIRVFMDKLGLKYGCIDMIVTKGGNYTFLEINPSGQWHFIQLRTGAKIAEEIAHLLI